MFYREGLQLLERIYVDNSTTYNQREHDFEDDGYQDSRKKVHICLKSWPNVNEGEDVEALLTSYFKRNKKYKAVIMYYPYCYAIEHPRDKVLERVVQKVPGYAMVIHRGIRAVTSSYICEAPSIIGYFNVAVIWSVDDLCYVNNPFITLLDFPLSALQQWLIMARQWKYETKENDKSPPPRDMVLKEWRDEVFPFSLFNHLLCQFKHRKADNKPLPIVLVEDCLGKGLGYWLCKSTEYGGIHIAYIGRLTGFYVQMMSAKDDGTDLCSCIVSNLMSYILERKPPCFLYRMVIQPCTFADRFTYVYEVS